MDPGFVNIDCANSFRVGGYSFHVIQALLINAGSADAIYVYPGSGYLQCQ